MSKIYSNIEYEKHLARSKWPENPHFEAKINWFFVITVIFFLSIGNNKKNH